MDVWTLNEQIKSLVSSNTGIEARVKHIEDYLAELSRKTIKDEVVQSKQDKSSGIRRKRRATKKS